MFVRGQKDICRDGGTGYFWIGACSSRGGQKMYKSLVAGCVLRQLQDVYQKTSQLEFFVWTFFKSGENNEQPARQDMWFLSRVFQNLTRFFTGFMRKSLRIVRAFAIICVQVMVSIRLSMFGRFFVISAKCFPEDSQKVSPEVYREALWFYVTTGMMKNPRLLCH